MTLNDVIVNFTESFRTYIVATILSLIVIYFIWNAVRFMNTSDEGERTDRRKAMIYGIITLAVAVSFWGLISILQTAFGITDSSSSIHTQIKSLF